MRRYPSNTTHPPMHCSIQRSGPRCSSGARMSHCPDWRSKQRAWPTCMPSRIRPNRAGWRTRCAWRVFAEPAHFADRSTGAYGYASPRAADGLAMIAFRGTQPDDPKRTCWPTWPCCRRPGPAATCIRVRPGGRIAGDAGAAMAFERRPASQAAAALRPQPRGGRGDDIRRPDRTDRRHHDRLSARRRHRLHRFAAGARHDAHRQLRRRRADLAARHHLLPPCRQAALHRQGRPCCTTTRKPRSCSRTGSRDRPRTPRVLAQPRPDALPARALTDHSPVNYLRAFF